MKNIKQEAIDLINFVESWPTSGNESEEALNVRETAEGKLKTLLERHLKEKGCGKKDMFAVGHMIVDKVFNLRHGYLTDRQKANMAEAISKYLD